MMSADVFFRQIFDGSTVSLSLVVTCWERVALLALLYSMFYCGYDSFSCGVLSQVWCLIVSIPDLCLLSYFKVKVTMRKTRGSR